MYGTLQSLSSLKAYAAIQVKTGLSRVNASLHKLVF